MATRRLEGWLFDIDELGPQVALWVYIDEGLLLKLTAEFRPPIYVQGERKKLKGLASQLERRGIISHVRWVEQREFWSSRQRLGGRRDRFNLGSGLSTPRPARDEDVGRANAAC